MIEFQRTLVSAAGVGALLLGFLLVPAADAAEPSAVPLSSTARPRLLVSGAELDALSARVVDDAVSE